MPSALCLEGRVLGWLLPVLAAEEKEYSGVLELPWVREGRWPGEH